MPDYVPGSTIRLSQLTGDYDPENKYHFNFTEEWKCMGVDLGANTQHDDATFIFFGDAIVSGIDDAELAKKLMDTDPVAFIDHPLLLGGEGVTANYQGDSKRVVAFFMDSRGRLYVNWSVSGGAWRGPVRISRAGVSVAGAELASAHQINDDQLDVFFINHDGRISVSWTKTGVDNEHWQGPQQIGYNDAARTKPGGCLTAAYQFDQNQLDVFFIDNNGALHVCWSVKGFDNDKWQGPQLIGQSGLAPAGAGIAAAHRAGMKRLDVFYAGNDGGIYVSAVIKDIDNNRWQRPFRIGLPGMQYAPPGAHIAVAHQVNDNQLDVFFIGNDGGLFVSWVAGEQNEFNGPVHIGNRHIAPPGAAIAAYKLDNGRFEGDSRVHVFFVGNDGGLYMAWAIKGGNWHGPFPVGPRGIAPPGARVGTAVQGSCQLDVFFIGYNGGLNVCWLNCSGDFHDPVTISDGDRLTVIMDNSNTHFYPFSYKAAEEISTLGNGSTPTGAFSYKNNLFVFFFHNKSATDFFSAVAGSSNPFAAEPYKMIFRFTTQKFFQVAPFVVNNAAFAGRPAAYHLPAAEGDGLIMFGHGDGAAGKKGVHLAWVPLTTGGEEDFKNIQYYAVNRLTKWSPREEDASMFFETEGWSAISVGRIPGTNQWILLSQTCGGMDYFTSFNGPIVARIANTPWGIAEADPVVIFDPVRDGALGKYMYRENHQDDHDLKHSKPALKHPAFAYGAFLLNHYTTYNSDTDTATIRYLMSSGKPYQVQVMQTSITGLTR